MLEKFPSRFVVVLLITGFFRAVGFGLRREGVDFFGMDASLSPTVDAREKRTRADRTDTSHHDQIVFCFVLGHYNISQCRGANFDRCIYTNTLSVRWLRPILTNS